MKYAYIGIGIVIGWLTIGMLFADAFGGRFWTPWQQNKIIDLLETIATNTDR